MMSWWQGAAGTLTEDATKTFAELFQEADGPHKDGRARYTILPCGRGASSLRGVLVEPSRTRAAEPRAVIYCPGGHAGDVFGEDALNLAEQLIEREVGFLCLDMARYPCEAKDVQLAVERLRDLKNQCCCQKLAVWGRGAGAAAALRYAACDPELAAVICDDAEAPAHEVFMRDLEQRFAFGSGPSIFRTCAAAPPPSASAAFGGISNIMGFGTSEPSVSLFDAAGRCQVPALFMYSLDRQRVALRLRQECARCSGQANVHQVSGTPSDCRQPTDSERALVLLVRAFWDDAEAAPPYEVTQMLTLPAHIKTLLSDEQQLYRRLGFLKAALRVRPMEKAKIERVLVEPPPGTLTVPGLDIQGTIVLPGDTSEVALAWAVEAGNGGGCVYFAFMAPQLLSLTVVHLQRLSRDADDLAYSIEDLKVLGKGPGKQKVEFLLQASTTLGLELKVGEDSLKVPPRVAWSRVDTGAGVGLGSGPTLWTAVCPAEPSSLKPRVDLWSPVNGSLRQLKSTPLQQGHGGRGGSSGGFARACRTVRSQSSGSSPRTGATSGGAVDASSLGPPVAAAATLLTCSSMISRTDGSLTMSAWSSQAPSPVSACTPVGFKGGTWRQTSKTAAAFSAEGPAASESLPTSKLPLQYDLTAPGSPVAEDQARHADGLQGSGSADAADSGNGHSDEHGYADDSHTFSAMDPAVFSPEVAVATYEEEDRPQRLVSLSPQFGMPGLSHDTFFLTRSNTWPGGDEPCDHKMQPLDLTWSF